MSMVCDQIGYLGTCEKRNNRYKGGWAIDANLYYQKKHPAGVATYIRI